MSAFVDWSDTLDIPWSFQTWARFEPTIWHTCAKRALHDLRENILIWNMTIFIQWKDRLWKRLSTGRKGRRSFMRTEARNFSKLQTWSWAQMEFNTMKNETTVNTKEPEVEEIKSGADLISRLCYEHGLFCATHPKLVLFFAALVIITCRWDNRLQSIMQLTGLTNFTFIILVIPFSSKHYMKTKIIYR